MSNTPARRRFIAGAVCPRCAMADKIVVDLESDTRECVACGFVEERPADKAAAQADSTQAAVAATDELPTRVSRPAARRVETAAQPVRLLDPVKKD